MCGGLGGSGGAEAPQHRKKNLLISSHLTKERKLIQNMQQKTTTKFCLNICSSMLNVKILVCVGCLFLWFEVLNGSLLLQKRYEKIFALSFARFFVGEHFLFWFGINQISPRLFSLLKFKRRAKWRTTICLVPFSEDKTLLWLATVWKFYLNIVFFFKHKKKRENFQVETRTNKISETL